MGEPYELLEEIGRGGMGTVHRARAADGRVVAVKRLALAPDPQELLRFVREQRLGRLLADAEGLVPVLDAYTDASGAPCLVLPFLPGGTLRDRLRRGPLSAAETVRIGRALARALGLAHAAGVIHRDVKPENVLFDAADRPWVADLGLAKHWRRDAPGGALSLSLTSPDEVAGTYAYLPPEAIAGSKHVGPGADVFALGVLLYECLAGQLPFSGNGGLYALASRVEGGDFAPLASAAPRTPQGLAAIVERCLRADPRERPRDGLQVAAALESLLPPPRQPASALGVVAVVGAALAVGTAGVLGLALSRRARPAGGAPAAVASLAVAGAPPAATSAPPPPRPPEWRLGAGQPPQLLAAALWADEGGREAWPLRPDPGALVAAWAGEAERLDGDRLRVRYEADDLARGRALLAQPSKRALVVHWSPPLASFGGAARLRAPGWSSLVRAVPGDGRWDAAAVRAELQAGVEDHGASGYYACTLGVGEARLQLLPRNGIACVGSSDVAFDGPRGPLTLALAPRAPEGDRVRVEAARVGPLVPLRAAAAALVPRGQAWFEGRGGAFDLERLVVEGRPLASDRPAMAVVPASAGGDVRLLARVTLQGGPDGPGAGGPLLALGAGELGDDRVTLELQGDRLSLSRGGRLLAEAPLQGPRPDAARLCLERIGGLRWVGWVAGPDVERLLAEVEVVEPLPLRASPVRALYGSTGPRVRFDELALHRLADDPRQDEVDAAAALASPLAGPRTLRDAAWEGAALLATVSAPGPDDAGLCGPAGAAARRERLTAARASLLQAATSDVLDARVRLDARARALVAAVLAGDADDAARQARALVSAEGGVEAARARVDALERDVDGRPALVRTLLTPLVGDHRPPRVKGEDERAARDREDGYLAIDRAGLLAGRALAPEHAAEVDHLLARLDRFLLHRDEDRDAGGLESVLAKLLAARAAGAPPGGLDGEIGDVLQALARLEEPARARERLVEAHAAWARYTDVEPGRWWAWLQRGLIDGELSQRAGEAAEARRLVDAAVEELVVTQALRPGALGGDPAGSFGALLAAAGPGRRAAFLLTCTPAARLQLVEPELLALGRAAAGAADLREADLGRYVLRRLGAAAPDAPAPDAPLRPTLALVRVPSGTGDGGLRAAAAADPLVRQLARLDPELAPLLQAAR